MCALVKLANMEHHVFALIRAHAHSDRQKPSRREAYIKHGRGFLHFQSANKTCIKFYTMVGGILGRCTAMIITVGKVKVFIVPKLKYAALFEKTTNKYLYQFYETTYDRLLKRVFRCSRIFN